MAITKLMSVLSGVSIQAIPGMPEIKSGDRLVQIISQAMSDAGVELDDRSVLVVAQKVVSKAEGRLIDLGDVTPSVRAVELAEVTGKDPRLVELVLSESSAILRAVPGVLIVRHRLGYVMANAGIDQSNVPGNRTGECALLLPLDPERSAQRIMSALLTKSGRHPGVIISDSFGRPWRNGVVNVALASAGIPALIDHRDGIDRSGRVLQVTQVAFADAIAAGAALVMGEASEGNPLALVTGLHWTAAEVSAQALIRPIESDLFQ